MFSKHWVGVQSKTTTKKILFCYVWRRKVFDRFCLRFGSKPLCFMVRKSSLLHYATLTRLWNRLAKPLLAADSPYHFWPVLMRFFSSLGLSHILSKLQWVRKKTTSLRTNVVCVWNCEKKWSSYSLVSRVSNFV